MVKKEVKYFTIFYIVLPIISLSLVLFAVNHKSSTAFLIAIIVNIILLIFPILSRGLKEWNKEIRWKRGLIPQLSIPTSLECPKCGYIGLRQHFYGEGGFPQLYTCPKCGYTGPIALKSSRENFKKKV